MHSSIGVTLVNHGARARCGNAPYLSSPSRGSLTKSWRYSIGTAMTSRPSTQTASSASASVFPTSRAYDRGSLRRNPPASLPPSASRPNWRRARFSYAPKTSLESLAADSSRQRFITLMDANSNL